MNILLKSIQESIREVVIALVWVIYAGIGVFFIGYAAHTFQWTFLLITLFQILLAVIHFVYGINKQQQEYEQSKTKPMTAKEYLEKNNIEDRYVYRVGSDLPKEKLSETLDDFVNQRDKTNEQ